MRDRAREYHGLLMLVLILVVVLSVPATVAAIFAHRPVVVGAVERCSWRVCIQCVGINLAGDRLQGGCLTVD